MAPSPTPRRNRSVRRQGRLGGLTAAALLAGTALLAACSSGPEGPSPEEAATVVTQGFALDPATQPCLQEAFSEVGGSTRALAVGGSASEGDRVLLRSALERCISAEDLAGIVSGSVGRGLGATTPQQDCLRQAVLDLDDSDRELLLVGLALSGDGAPDEIDVELGRLTSRLFEQCSVQAEGPSGTAPAATTGTTTPG